MKRVLIALSAAVLMYGCAREEVVVNPAEKQEQTSSENGDYIEGEVIVKLSDELTSLVEEDLAAGNIATRSAGLNALMQDLGIKSMTRLFPDAGEFEPRTRKEGLHKWYIIQFDESVSLTKADNELESLDGIELVEKRRKIKNQAFNDTYFGNHWGYVNNTRKGYDINVSDVWANYTTGSEKVIVSVVDEGVDLNHPDLAWNCLESGHYNAVDGNQVIYAGSHGTHVAGTVAAVNNNGKGVCGVAGGDFKAGSKGVRILSCQIFKEVNGENKTGNTAAAIKWGADHGAVISQNSWGYSYDKDGDGKLTGDEYQAAISATIQDSDRAAVDYFIKYAGCDNSGNQLPNSMMKGGVVIFAAGNDGIENGAPANYAPVIAVGAISKDGTKASYSNYGTWCDIAAPGTDIVSTLPNGQYGNLTGTSMACPHVSGVAALVVSYCGGPGFTNDMLKEKLLKSANTSLLSSSYKIGGLVDAMGAITYGADEAPAAVKDMKAEGRSNNIDLTWTLTADSKGEKAFGYMVIYGKDKAAVESSTFKKPASNVSYTSLSPEGKVGAKVTGYVSGLEFNSKYYVKMAAYSYGRSYSEGTSVAEISTGSNNPPIIKVDYNGELSLNASDVVEIPVTIIEPDSHEFTVTYTKGSEADVMSKTPSGNWYITITGSDAEEGEYTGIITAKDSYGMSATYKLKYTIKVNHAPAKIKDIENRLENNKGEFTIDLSEYFSDPDGDRLTYEVVASDPSVAFFTPRENSLICTVLKYGHTTVTVTAKDPRNASATAEFVILARAKSTVYSAYPNPVTTTLNLATGQDLAAAKVKIVSQTGQVVIDKTVNASAFEPAQIDFKNVAPGIYNATFTIGSKEYNQTIIKK